MKLVFRLDDVAVRAFRLEVRQFDRVARFQLHALSGQIVGRPGVQQNFVVAHRTIGSPSES